jgi:hypothetical protein
MSRREHRITVFSIEMLGKFGWRFCRLRSSIYRSHKGKTVERLRNWQARPLKYFSKINGRHLLVRSMPASMGRTKYGAIWAKFLPWLLIERQKQRRFYVLGIVRCWLKLPLEIVTSVETGIYRYNPEAKLNFSQCKRLSAVRQKRNG